VSEASAALILGASSGFGAAIARAFAREGRPIVGVHLDRRSTIPAVEALVDELQGLSPAVTFFNRNAASDSQRAAIVEQLARDGVQVGVLVHSLAFGTLVDLVRPPGDTDGSVASRKQLDMTLDVMAHSLVYWAQDLVHQGVLGEGGRIWAMTSSGSHLAFDQYGPVSAAKAALEAHVRQLCRELAPRGITANAIMAGVTQTPALEKIPGHQQLIERARSKNPHRRLTRPDDVAAALIELSRPGTYWMSGNTIRVDGGEDVCP
jgi:NAD(P)-dependent dehydrogenase (short-subunit alcohol dehydrogenase family)